MVNEFMPPAIMNPEKELLQKRLKSYTDQYDEVLNMSGKQSAIQHMKDTIREFSGPKESYGLDANMMLANDPEGKGLAALVVELQKFVDQKSSEA